VRPTRQAPDAAPAKALQFDRFRIRQGLAPSWDLGWIRAAMRLKRYRHTREKIVRKLREGGSAARRGALGAGGDQAAGGGGIELSPWRPQYGGMAAEHMKRPKELETEDARLKRIVADEGLEVVALKEFARGRMKVKPSLGFGCSAACRRPSAGRRLGRARRSAARLRLAPSRLGVRWTPAGGPARAAGLELDRADRLGHRGREGVGVVLFADEEVLSRGSAGPWSTVVRSDPSRRNGERGGRLLGSQGGRRAGGVCGGRPGRSAGARAGRVPVRSG
jgi:putative transposase